MKKYILLLIVLFISVLSFGQKKTYLQVDNPTDTFRVNIPRGYLVYDTTNTQFYQIQVAGNKLSTLDTITKKALFDSIVIYNLGYRPGDHTVDTQLDSSDIYNFNYRTGDHTDSTDISDFGYVVGAADGINIYDTNGTIGPNRVVTLTDSLSIDGGDVLIKGLTDNYLFFLDHSTDKIGIGTSTPLAELEVVGGFAAIGTVGSISTDARAPLSSSGIQIKAEAAKPYISNTLGVNDATGAFTVWSAALSSLFTVQGGGLVGVGTSSPNAPLDVNGNLHVRDIGKLFTNAVQTYSASDLTFTSANSKDIILKAGGVETMRLVHPNNYVGIGIATPTARLEVKGLGSTSGTRAIDILNSSSDNLFRVDNVGNIMIGTATPSKFVSIRKDISSIVLAEVSNQSEGSLAGAGFNLSTDGSRSQLIGYGTLTIGSLYGTAKADFTELSATTGAGLMIGTRTSPASPVIFGTANLERARFSPTGEFGVGVDDPQAILHIAASTATSPAILIEPGLSDTAVAGALEYDDDHWYVSNGARHVLVRSTGIVTETVTVVNSDTLETVYKDTMVVGELHHDERFSLDITGAYSNASASDNFTVIFYFGGTAVDSVSRSGGNVTDSGWKGVFEISIRESGASGTFVHYLHFIDGTGIQALAHTPEHSIDTTVENIVEVKVRWDNAKVGNTFSLTQGDLQFKH